MDWFPTAKGSQEVINLEIPMETINWYLKQPAAIISIKWSYEGAFLAAAFEYSQIKIFSRGDTLI